ncbi:MAG TPA: hypothetical protein VNX70_17220 [Bryobacteraceae bacterium]|nr:hypothetical protein [Bryobacteraceae bacterium]
MRQSRIAVALVAFVCAAVAFGAWGAGLVGPGNIEITATAKK